VRLVFVVVVEELGDAVTTGVPAVRGVQIDVIIFYRAPQAVNAHRTAPPKANNLLKRVRRVAFGLTNFENFRIRALLCAGKPNFRVLDSIVVR